MLEALLAGAAAGYAIAIPVGAIAVLIIQTGAREGFGHGVAAAAGAATADGVYATLASIAGLAITQLIGSLVTPLRIVGGLLLMVIGARGLLGIRSSHNVGESETTPAPDRLRRHTYFSFLALTALNPATVIYLASLTVGLPLLGGLGERLGF